MNADLLKATHSYKATSGLMDIASGANALIKNTDNQEGEGGGDFASLLSNSLSSFRNVVQRSENLSAKTLMNDANLADVVTAVTEAETALQTVISLRDKVIAAYQDILKMPI